MVTFTEKSNGNNVTSNALPPNSDTILVTRHNACRDSQS